MARDLGHAFLAIDDPFNKEGKIGLVEALRPDISIIHGCVADREGNTILGAPVGDDVWGAFASRGGVLVTVEKIVTTDFIRKHSSLVKIPGYAVKTVSLAPFGAHPFSLVDPGIGDFEPYGMDSEFLTSLGKASRDPSDLDAWIDEWVISCPAHDDYLTKLGSERLAKLKRAGAGDMPVASSLVLPEGENCSPEEMMLVVTAREVVRSDPPAQPYMPSPCLGEHTAYVCTEILGMSDEEFINLMQEGVFE